MKKKRKTITMLLVSIILCGSFWLVLDACNTSPKKYEGIHNRFVPVGSMVTHREYHHGILLNSGEVLFLHGGRKPYTNTAEQYNPETGQFRATGMLLGERILDTVTLLNNGKVLIVGGEGRITGQPPGCLRYAELYDPVIGQSRLTGMLNQPRANHQVTLLNNGKVLITGGSHECCSEKEYNQILKKKEGFELSSTELYDPATGIFALSVPMHNKRSGHRATLLQDGNVLITGGSNEEPLDSAELYLAKENRFIELPARMIYPRAGHSALLLNNGNVLLVGGVTIPDKAIKGRGNAVIQDLEIFEPKKQKFIFAGRLKFPVGTCTNIILLPNETVFITEEQRTQIYDPKTQGTVNGAERFYKRGGYSAVGLKNGDVLITCGYNWGIFPEPMELYKF
jgi:large repetitive protein